MTENQRSLEWATSNELLDELMGRYEAMIFSGVNQGKVEFDKEYALTSRWYGGHIPCLGLLDAFQHKLKIDMTKTSRPDGDAYEGEDDEEQST